MRQTWRALVAIVATVLLTTMVAGCAEPLPEADLRSAESELEELLPGVASVRFTSGTAGEVTIVTVEATLTYESLEDFHASDVSTVMHWYEESWTGGFFGPPEKGVTVMFDGEDIEALRDDADSRAVGIPYIASSPDTMALLDDELDFYIPADANPLVGYHAECVNVDGAVLPVRPYGTGWSLHDYTARGDAWCVSQIRSGDLIRWESGARLRLNARVSVNALGESGHPAQDQR